MSMGEFSVYQFFTDGKWEKVAAFIDCGSAVGKAHVCCNNIAALIGTARRVIITDGEDHIVWDWRLGIGLVFPTLSAADIPCVPRSP